MKQLARVLTPMYSNRKSSSFVKVKGKLATSFFRSFKILILTVLVLFLRKRLKRKQEFEIVFHMKEKTLNVREVQQLKLSLPSNALFRLDGNRQPLFFKSVWSTCTVKKI